MSITQATLISEIPENVIVRCYGNRPARLKAVGRLDHAVEVYRENPNLSIGWPEAFVYRDDSTVFADIERAWESGDEQLMTAAWETAQRY